MGRSKLTEMMDVPMEMVGRESVVATWNLRMQGDDGEVRKRLLNKDSARELAKERNGRAECVDGFQDCLPIFLKDRVKRCIKSFWNNGSLS
jgi:hypothetical protein